MRKAGSTRKQNLLKTLYTLPRGGGVGKVGKTRQLLRLLGDETGVPERTVQAAAPRPWRPSANAAPSLVLSPSAGSLLSWVASGDEERVCGDAPSHATWDCAFSALGSQVSLGRKARNFLFTLAPGMLLCAIQRRFRWGAASPRGYPQARGLLFREKY